MIELPQLRQYQENLKDDIYWSIKKQHDGICAVSPTGSGKSKTMGSLVCDFISNGKQCIMVVHRQELVKQLSVMLGEYQIHHQIIAPKQISQRLSMTT
jgi:superfamily II DNA or RNA helicase